MPFTKSHARLGFLMLWSAVSRADYGWVPDYQKLNLRLGGEYFSTQDNYLPNATVGPLTSGATSRLNDLRFYLEGEYGIAADWAAKVKINFVNPVLDGGTTGTLANSSGFGDMWTSLKWNFKPQYPMLTFEALVKAPLARPYISSAGELVRTDGNFEIGGVFHTATRAGTFLFSMSPGIIARLGGYSPAAIADVAVQFNMRRGYLRAFGTSIVSFQDVDPFDAAPPIHDAPGSGGSYAKLSGSPTGVALGAKLGLAPADNFRVEVEVQRSVYGMKYPSFMLFGLNVRYTFDFFQPKKTTRLKEVPFEGEQPNGFPATP